MTLSFTSNASAMTKPQDLWFLPLASGGWCYHTQQDGRWAPDTTGPWSFPHYGEETPGGSLDLGYPLPGGRGTPGLQPGPRVLVPARGPIPHCNVPSETMGDKHCDEGSGEELAMIADEDGEEDSQVETEAPADRLGGKVNASLQGDCSMLNVYLLL